MWLERLYVQSPLAVESLDRSSDLSTPVKSSQVWLFPLLVQRQRPEDLLELGGYQPSSRFRERLWLKGIRHRKIEQDASCWPPASAIIVRCTYVCTHTSAYNTSTCAHAKTHTETHKTAQFILSGQRTALDLVGNPKPFRHKFSTSQMGWEVSRCHGIR
jgi:hypothetical protein